MNSETEIFLFVIFIIVFFGVVGISSFYITEYNLGNELDEYCIACGYNGYTDYYSNPMHDVYLKNYLIECDYSKQIINATNGYYTFDKFGREEFIEEPNVYCDFELGAR